MAGGMSQKLAWLLLIASVSVQAQSSTIAQAPGPDRLGTANTEFSANDAPLVGDGWREGRATFYDAPDYFAEAFAVRGNGSFGNILYGDCQYYSRPQGGQSVTYADQQYPIDAVAGAATTNIDYPRSCGGCYELKCRNGLVIANGTTPVSTSDGFNLQAIAPDTLDTFGNKFPGNPASAQNENFVRCNNDTDSIYITITDSCPCSTNQQWCCGPVQHFDLSFWAFERLAHPLYGTMMLDFRPVDCYTKQPFQNFVPAFLNETIYGDRVETGWSYNVYTSDANQFALPGAGIGGSNATCLAPRAKGGLTFTARNGTIAGYQPFAAATSLTFAIRNNGTTSTGTPQGLKFTIQNTEAELYCGGDVIPGQTHQPTSTQDGYSVFSVPIGDFGCTDPPLTNVDAIGIQNTGSATTPFCLDNLVIVGAPANDAVAGRKLKF